MAKNLGVAPRADVKAIVDKANADTAPLRNVVIGRQSFDILRDDPARLKESAMGNFVADAMRVKYAPGASRPRSRTPGGLREDLFFARALGGEQPGEVTWGEAFAVLPFGNATVIETLDLRPARGGVRERAQAAVRRHVGRHRAHAAVLGPEGHLPLQRRSCP